MKGQAALEFLTTYGWALMGVLVIIGAIAYLGIGNIEPFKREECSFGAQLPCIEYKVTTTEVKLIVQNAYGKDIELSNLVIENSTANCPPGPVQVKKIEKEELSCPILGSDFPEGTTMDKIMQIQVQTGPGSPLHNVKGILRAKVQG